MIPTVNFPGASEMGAQFVTATRCSDVRTSRISEAVGPFKRTSPSIVNAQPFFDGVLQDFGQVQAVFPGRALEPSRQGHRGIHSFVGGDVGVGRDQGGLDAQPLPSTYPSALYHDVWLLDLRPALPTIS